jgi:hypothetical protein
VPYRAIKARADLCAGMPDGERGDDGSPVMR